MRINETRVVGAARRLKAVAIAATALTGVLIATPGAAQVAVTGDPALYWSNVVSSTLAGSPITTSRSIAMAQVAIFEAANATTGRNYNSQVNFASNGGDTRAAIAVAAHHVLVSVNPAGATGPNGYNAKLAEALSQLPAGSAKELGIATGLSAGMATVANRMGDGSNLTLAYTPQAPGTPGAWQPTPPGNLAAALPQWQNVTPWTMTSTSQFNAAPPPALNSSQYAADFNEVKDYGGMVSALRTADQTTNALVWAGTSARAAVLPWQDVGIALAQSNGMSTTDAARMLALLAMGNADTLISLWNTKFQYDFWRPVTAIQNAGIDGNDLTIADPGWMSRVTTPNYPSHSSGIAAIAGNAQTVLTSFFGNTNDFCIASAAGQQCYGSFTAASRAAADARVHGGMHFRFETDTGLIQGQSIAGFTLKNALAPVPEPQTWALLITGFGFIGAGLRSRKRPQLNYITT